MKSLCTSLWVVLVCYRSWRSSPTGFVGQVFWKAILETLAKAIISATLEGKNTLVIQSTGAGKSLCFQFPCVATKTLTVVLMPTISLIKDQYQHLEVTGLRTTFLGTLQTDKSILSMIAQMEFDLVLCTPESFYDSVGTPKPVFKTLALQRRIGLIAIDEAHLVNSWSSFRYVSSIKTWCCIIPLVFPLRSCSVSPITLTDQPTDSSRD